MLLSREIGAGYRGLVMLPSRDIGAGPRELGGAAV